MRRVLRRALPVGELEGSGPPSPLDDDYSPKRSFWERRNSR
jgi:hypothetical protein